MIYAIELSTIYCHAMSSIACRNFIYDKPSVQEGAKN